MSQRERNTVKLWMQDRNAKHLENTIYVYRHTHGIGPVI